MYVACKVVPAASTPHPSASTFRLTSPSWSGRCPPEVKRGVKEALRLLSTDPGAGSPLRRELDGYRRYKVRRYRIVYQRHHRVVRVLAVGHRRTIYEDLGERLKAR